MLKYHISDYIGKRYGHLIVIGQSENCNIPNAFDFKCDCGNIVPYAPDRVIKGHQKSCGKCEFSNNQPARDCFEKYIGKKSNMLTVIGISKKLPNDKRTYLNCKCDCGNTVRVLPYQFNKGKVKSCGCLKHLSYNHIDGRTINPLYELWFNMIDRCENPNHPKYYRYGKRGVKVCDEWHDFNNFVSWSDSIGGRPDGYSIERINNNGNYEPSNCKWASSKEQSENKSTTIYLEYNGETKSLPEWCRITGLSWDVIYNRLQKGWSVEKALSTPKLR